MARPTLRQLEYLIALEDTRSFSLAAQESHVTQSTLSAGIKELEEILGQQLARRGRRDITLTPFGQEVADNARKILAQADKIMERSRKMEAPLTGPLRLGIIPTIAPYLLPQILPHIQKQYPNLELQIFEDLSQRITEDIERGQLDLILLAFPYNTAGMVQTPLWKEEFVLATTDKNAKKSVTLADLENEHLLLLEDGHCLRDHALSACRLAPPAARKTFSATSLPTLIQMVSSGYGSTLLPRMVAQTALPKNVKTVPFKSPRPTREIGLAWRLHDPKAKDFECLAKTVKNAYKTAL